MQGDKSGFGTKHMKERIKMLSGVVTFDGSDGFTVNARIPIRWGRLMIKVLIADDQELIRQSLQIVLQQQAGHNGYGCGFQRTGGHPQREEE